MPDRVSTHCSEARWQVFYEGLGMHQVVSSGVVLPPLPCCANKQHVRSKSKPTCHITCYITYLWCAADAHHDVYWRLRLGCLDGATHITIADHADACACCSDVCDKLCMTGTIQHKHCHITAMYKQDSTRRDCRWCNLSRFNSQAAISLA
jgi:hypothetical protein